MKVHEAMTQRVVSCSPGDDLAAAAMVMWRNDCGVVPVVDDERRAIGVITDRDICMAVATRHLRAEEIRVADALGAKLYALRPDDTLRVALDTMKRERVRRLPVLDDDRKLLGMLSINDLIRLSARHKTRPPAGLGTEDLLEALRIIGSPAEVPLTAIERELVPAG
jgi:CBS domain-containing protein